MKKALLRKKSPKRYIEECKKDMEGMNIQPANEESSCNRRNWWNDQHDRDSDRKKVMPMKRTELFITVQESSQNTASCPIKIWMICSPVDVHCL